MSGGDPGGLGFADGFLGFGGTSSQTGETFLLRALGVEFEEAGEDFVAGLVGPAVVSRISHLSVLRTPICHCSPS